MASSLMSRSPRPKVRNSLIAFGLTGLFSLFGIGLYALCLERQAHFEAKMVELESLKSERRELRLHNEKMHERVAYLQTDEGIEEIAREKLGLVRPGELAYAVVPPPPDSFVQADQEDTPHLDAQRHAEQQEDFGVIVRALRHLFGPGKPSTTASV